MGILDDFMNTMNGLTPAQMSTVAPGQTRPFSLNAIGGALDVFGADMGAASHVMFGIQARQAMTYQAAQLRQNAQSAAASGEREAYDVGQQTQFITSRALAVAAAGGGGASDPTVVNMIARDAGRGAYLKSLALYSGQDRARLMSMEADAKTFQGKEMLGNSLLTGAAQATQGATNLLQSQARGQSLFERFGGGGPNVSDGWSTNPQAGV